MLNELVGEIVEELHERNKHVLVCVGSSSDHPKKMVVNGFTRRGVKVYKAAGSTILNNVGMVARTVWLDLGNLNFSTEIEDWD